MSVTSDWTERIRERRLERSGKPVPALPARPGCRQCRAGRFCEEGARLFAEVRRLSALAFLRRATWAQYEEARQAWIRHQVGA